jgi:hypothetical protein
MGGFGSGRSGGRPTVERAVRLDIDSMMCWGEIQPGFHLGGEMRLHQFYGDDIEVKFESLAGDPENSWLRLRYSIADYWSGEELKIDDKVYLAPTRPHFGGLRWWFVCPYLNRRVRKLYLPLGERHFWSRRAYEFAYASQRETKYDRALRRARKLRLRLGGEPAGDEYPDKPPRMRWATYNRLMDRLVAADGVADERLVPAARAWAIMDQGRP